MNTSQEEVIHHKPLPLAAALTRVGTIVTGDESPEGVNFATLQDTVTKLVKAEATMQACLRAAKALPNDPELYFKIALAFHNAGRYHDAEMAYRDALSIKPDFPEAHNNMGLVIQEQGRLKEAMHHYLRAIQLNPGYAVACNNLGSAMKTSGLLDKAKMAFQAAIELDEGYAEAHNNLGVLYKCLGEIKPAEICYRNALRANPNYAAAHNNIGVIYRDRDWYAKAAAEYQKAVTLKPDYADAYNNLAVVLKELDDPAGADQAYVKALEIDPTYADARLNIALYRLAMGRYAEAWPDHEARFSSDPNRTRSVSLPKLEKPMWRDEDLTGKHLLIWPEQGHGDYVQFIRFVAPLKERGIGEITVVCSPPIAPLLATAQGVDRVVKEGEPLPEYDYWVYSMSLPYHLGTTLDTLPAKLPYLWALPDRKALWQERLPPGDKLKIGLIWKGNPDYGNDRFRSLKHFTDLAPLWTIPNVDWISLQKGAGEDEPLVHQDTQPCTILGPLFKDFSDTAALIACLDLVITVDTSAAHIAGALGIPCWVFIPRFGTDWRWLYKRQDSPWYPCIRLIHQLTEANGDLVAPPPWRPTVEHMVPDLIQWISARRQGRP